MFEGTYTALLTPFSTGEVDYKALAQLIERQVAGGVDGVVPCGSTGESATLNHDEHERVIAFTIETVRERIKVIAGTGSNSTRESIRLTKSAKGHGADGALLIAPYYNKPTQEGLFAHYSAVAEQVQLPQLVYNIPGRAGVNISPETMARLAQVENIVGVKDASGSLDQVTRTIEACGPHFTLLSGDDTLTLPMLAVGGRGVIAVISNVTPQKMVDLVRSAMAGDYATARKLHYELLPLMSAMGLETNPIAVKAALAAMGLINNELRLPLQPLTEVYDTEVRRRLKVAHLL